jgi:hypothetical protein
MNLESDARIGTPPVNEGTAGSVLPGYPESLTTTSQLSATVGWLRSRAEVVRDDAGRIHREVRDYDLDQRAAVKARRDVQALLGELSSERGLAWSSIARLVGVSVTAVRKWRASGGATAQSRYELARLAAFLDLLSESAIDDPAGWMEMRLPLPSGHNLTPFDLYETGHTALILDYAGQRLTAGEVLDDIDPQWRERRSSFEVFDAPDGMKAIRQRSGSNVHDRHGTPRHSAE